MPLEPPPPLLQGASARDAEAALGAVAEDLGRWLASDPQDATLGHGLAGVALFFAALGSLTADARAKAQAEGCLARAITLAGEQLRSPGLFFGAAGVAWTACLLGAKEQLDDSVDDVLLALLQEQRWQGDHDLLSGLVGLGLYFLERGEHQSSRAALELVVARLHAQVLPEGPGASLHTPAALLQRRTGDPAQRGHRNLGMAHGLPGAIAFLGRAAQAGVAGASALQASLYQGLLYCRRPSPWEPGEIWPAWLEDGQHEPQPASRSAWCYGDVGIALGLLRGSGAPGTEAQAELGLVVAAAAAGRPQERSGVRDGGLCHGAAGLGHLFHRLARATRGAARTRFADAARRWFLALLALRRPGEGVGGYLSWDLGPSGELGWQAAPGLLGGAAGVGLALCAALGWGPLRWDSALLVDVPEVAHG